MAAVASTFPLLILPVGAAAPPKLVLAGSHCFLLDPVTAIYNVHRVDVRSWPPPNPTTEPSIELEPKRFAMA